MPYVYLLECADGSFYAGSTWDLWARLAQHNSPRHGATYTRRRRPVRVVWALELESIAEAYAVEKQIQGWSRRKRIALIEGRLSALPGLSGRGHASVVSRQAPERLPQPPWPRNPGD